MARCDEIQITTTLFHADTIMNNELNLAQLQEISGGEIIFRDVLSGEILDLDSSTKSMFSKNYRKYLKRLKKKNKRQSKHSKCKW